MQLAAFLIDAGIIEQDIESAVLTLYLLGKALDRLFACDIQPVAFGLPAGGLDVADRAFDLVFVDVGAKDGGPFLGKQFRRGGPDTGSGPGHNGDALINSAHDRLPLVGRWRAVHGNASGVFNKAVDRTARQPVARDVMSQAGMSREESE